MRKDLGLNQEKDSVVAFDLPFAALRPGVLALKPYKQPELTVIR
jgi:hypothetical protein